jgi:hypothetical protein
MMNISVNVDTVSSGTFPFYNRLKQGDALFRLLFNFGIGYAISKVQENREGRTRNSCNIFRVILLENIYFGRKEGYQYGAP